MSSMLARWREKFFPTRTPVKIEGACKQTGNCCRSLILVHRGKPIERLEDFQRMSTRDPEAQMFVPHDEARADGLMRFRCTNLLENNHCGIYVTRPEMCRAYPTPAMFERGGSLLAGCGYRVVSNDDVEISFGEVLGQTLQETALGSGDYPEDVSGPGVRKV